MSEPTAAAVLSQADEARGRDLLLRGTPSRDDPFAWRSWASNLTWIVPRYAPRLIAALDARAAAAREEGRRQERERLRSAVEGLDEEWDRDADGNEYRTGISRAAVLALLDEPVPA